jgi:hypothetical protein
MVKGVNFSRQNVVVALIAVIILLFIFIHFFWNNPNRVFNQMLGNTLTTSNYTKTINDNVNKQKTTQVISIETGAVNRVFETQILGIPYYDQGLVKIISIGTPTTDYSKYVTLNTPARDSQGLLVDYSKALGIWGKSSPDGLKVTGGQVFNQAVVDVVPMANVNPALRTQFLTYIKTNKVYSFNNKVSSISVNGRPQLIYNVTINLHYLQNYLNQFGAAIGLNQYDSKKINISTLPVTDTEKAQFYVDSLTRRLVSIKLTGTNRSYSYSSYGAKLQINLPNKYMQLADLEKYIQSLATK